MEKNNHDTIQEQTLENTDSVQENEHVDAQSHEQMEDELANQVQECQQELAQWKEQCIRVAADFENFKKRLEKERAQLSRVIKSNIVTDLLPLVDNFERALSAEQESENCHSVLQGFEMIYKELRKTLKKQGVEEIAFEKTFNPEFHEAVMTVESEEHNSGEIVDFLQKGFMLEGEVLRPAKVSIAA